MTIDIWLLAKAETLIRQLQEFAGPTLNGQVILREIRFVLSNPTTATILIDLCARNSAMDQTMGANPIPSPANLSFPSTLSRTFSPNTLRHSLRIYYGRSAWIVNSADMDTLLASLGENVGFSVGETIQLSFEKPSLTIHKVPSP